jgi:hypothetical protein
VALASALPSSPVFSAEPNQAGIEAIQTRVRPSVAAVRIGAADAPAIDGNLSDVIWARAMPITEFRQKNPNVGAPATELTEVRVLYDENNLYVAVHAFDSVAEDIVIRGMERDGPMFNGDAVSLQIDPGQTRRNGYRFMVGASGGRLDSLLLNNSSGLDQWDQIWQARTAISDDGWTAEYAIPFRILSYETGQADWGFDIRRIIARKNEEVYWSAYNPNFSFADVTQLGILTGIQGINQGIGLDVQVYGVGRVKRDWHIPGEDTGLSFTGGANAFYRITPALTGTLTFNPDFSDTPLDARQVNTTRFSLFFPETRDFFLQDAGAFEFGGRGFTRMGQERPAQNGRPFFSRNIGLVNGQPVSIIAGGKLSGEFAGFGIGALSVVTDKVPNEGNQVLSVARLSRRLFQDSQLGMIFTNGDPTGETGNSVAGVDYQYRNTNFLGDYIVQADAYYERSFSSTLGDDDAYGIAVNLPNEPWGGGFAFKEVGTDFEPALGFVNRTGIRDYEANLRHLTRFAPGALLRTLTASARGAFVTDLDSRLQSREFDAGVAAFTRDSHTLDVGVTHVYERIGSGFLLPGDVLVPAGTYEWTNLRTFARSSQFAALSVQAEFTCCSFYNGNSIETVLSAEYRPNRFYAIVASHQWTGIDLPTGDVDIHVGTVNGSVTFTPDMQLALQAQYDNISESFGFLVRYRWEFSPGTELLVAFGQAALIPETGFAAQRSQLTVRIGHTLQF